MQATRVEVECDPYKESMLRLLDYIGLQGYGTPHATMPARTADERDRIAEHLCAPTREIVGESFHSGTRNSKFREKGLDIPDPEVQTTIYLSPQETLEWKAFLTGTAVDKRHAVSVRRRLSLNLWQAHTRKLCLWCWFPREVCMCAKLREYRASLPLDLQKSAVQFTMFLHVEEVLRRTNTGHLAAYLLGAPLRVWGVPGDDAYMAQLQSTENCLVFSPTTGQTCGALSSTIQRIHHLFLYPEKGAFTIESYIHKCLDSELVKQPDGATTRSITTPVEKLHFILLDSTWGQALSLNRHIPRCLPRVSLVIQEEYEALFSSLRKRTRKSGVSTFEATIMAIEQYLCASDMKDIAALVVHTLMDAMKEFVDTTCLLKFTNPRFGLREESLKEVVLRRDLIRREAAEHRKKQLALRIQTDFTARQLLLPPVLNYCYCCDCMIMWHHMPEHVLGRRHRAALRLNVSCEPSDVARDCVLADSVYLPG